MPTLLYNAGALGDFITVLPALSYWRKGHPDDRLTFLGNTATGGLALDASLIDEAWDIDSARFVPLFRERYSAAAAELLAPFDAAVVFAGSPSPLLANLRRKGMANLHSQRPFPAGPGVPIADYHLSLFTDPGALSLGEKIPRLSPSAKAMARAKELLPADGAPVALHPGSGSRLKNWPIGRYREVAEILRARGFRVAWIKGPADSPVAVPSGDLIVDEPPLPILAAFLAGCRLFIGNDGGVAHLAAAVGCATVTVFGPSDPATWAPRGHAATIVCAGVDCSPCHLRENRQEGCGRECLEKITVGEVAAAVDGLLGRQRNRRAGF
jgi:heptosyltransferase-2